MTRMSCVQAAELQWVGGLGHGHGERYKRFWPYWPIAGPKKELPES